MTDTSLPELLRQLGDYAEITGASAEANAWRRLSRDFSQLADAEMSRLTGLAEEDRLPDFPGVPIPLRRKLQQVLLQPAELSLAACWASIPALLRRLVEFAGVSSSTAASLARMGIVSLTDLDGALDDGRIAAHLPQDEQSLRLARGTLNLERQGQPLGRAMDTLDNFLLLVAAACPELRAVVPAGDVRRCEAMVEALVVVGAAPDPPATLQRICALPMLQGSVYQTARRALVRYQQCEVDVRVSPPDEYGSALQAATGSAAHVAAVRARHRAGRLFAREEQVYSHAGLPWIAPEIRQNTGEVEAAAAGRLPDLVSREHIRGDLHMHSTYSDGRDTLATIVQAAAALGYEYVAITDHSERAGASRTVTLETLERQREEIARLRERFPSLAILHGIEVDIMPDGRLDFPDDVLASLDIVLASLHDSAGHDPARLTRRCLGAMRHPLVNVITHPANRLPGRYPGHDLDFDRIYAAAAETGTALEIDGAPTHLDLDGDRARAAVAAGVTVTIDSDCHKATLLDRQMRLGIGTARRGWVEPAHVLNTRPVADVRAFVAAKRTGRA